MIKKDFEEYSLRKLQIKKLTDEIKELGDKLKTQMKEDKVDVVNSEFGKFSMTIRKQYKYSESVVNQKADLKLAEIEDIEEGKASVTEIDVLTFRPDDDVVVSSNSSMTEKMIQD